MAFPRMHNVGENVQMGTQSPNPGAGAPRHFAPFPVPMICAGSPRHSVLDFLGTGQAGLEA